MVTQACNGQIQDLKLREKTYKLELRNAHEKVKLSLVIKCHVPIHALAMRVHDTCAQQV